MKTAGAVVGAVAIWAVAVAIQAWIVMLAAMVINNYWTAFPAFSFLESVVISMFVALFFSVVRGSK